jgi:hypothetical protein
MRRVILVIVVVGVATLTALLLGADLRIALPVAVVIGEGIGMVPGGFAARRARQRDRAITGALLTHLIDMGDTLQEVSIESLQQRGGWDRSLFDDVLARVEEQTPVFQAALIDYVRWAETPRAGRVLAALLAVDRLSAAYTYWTRLFPPGKQAESRFVLSLLQDLSEKVEAAIHLLTRSQAKG